MVSQWHQLELITINIINVTTNKIATLLLTNLCTLSPNFPTCPYCQFTQFSPPSKLLASLLSFLPTYLLSHPHSGILDTTLLSIS